MLKLYARLEPTTDPLLKSLGLGMSTAQTLPSTSTTDLLASGFFGKLDVAVYKDPEAKHPMARFTYGRKRPTPNRTKRVTINCYSWQLEWLSPHLPRNDIAAAHTPQVQ